MSIKDSIVHSTDWLDLRKKRFENLDVDYIYVHSPKTGGNAVAVLPFRKTEFGMRFLLRKEIVPPWDAEEHTICSMTGGHDQPTTRETAQKELLEEAGYRVGTEDFIELGKCRNSKASDTTYHLFAIDLTGFDAVEPQGDGSPLEEEAESFWAPHRTLLESPDMMLHSMYMRLTS